MNRSSRWPIVLVLIVSLLAAGFTRRWASVERVSNSSGISEGGSHYSTTNAGLSRMNSYALALLLGGLRGPLVMFLWPSAEQQKAEKNLEDFDTKIEWIRLLQAEFDTVHIFQIWNKAYNISVQMANLSNKYRTILDAIDYAKSVDAEKPNDINIIYAIGGIYFDKFGTSNEKAYYRERVREESMARQELVRVIMPVSQRDQFIATALDAGIASKQLRFSENEKSGTTSITLNKPQADLIQPKFSGAGISYTPRARVALRHDDPAWRRMELDPMLDAQGNILPELIKPRYTKPASVTDDNEWNDGSELQYLKQFQPFPYGLSAFALAYNYHQRAAILQRVYKQKHAQLSDLVVDSRPALALKNWSEDDWERARRAELEAFDQPIPADRIQMESPTAKITLDTPIPRPARLPEAIYELDRGRMLCAAALKEYERHLKLFTNNITTYMSHMDDLRNHAALMAGDHAFLMAMTTKGEERVKWIAAAKTAYTEAIRRNDLIILTYYTTDDMVSRFYPRGVNKGNVVAANLPDDQLNDIAQKVYRSLPSDLNLYQFGDDINEYYTYLSRAQSRMKSLGQ